MATARRINKRKRRMWRDAFLLVAPFFLLYLVFFIYPTFRVVQLSFTESPLIGEGRFIGLENYRTLMGDAMFWRSLRNTFYFVFLTVVPNTALGLLFALMVVRLRHLKGVVLAAFFLPFMLPVSVVTLIFQWLLNTQFGILQPVLDAVAGKNLAVFSNRNWAMPTVAFITVWWTVGFNMLLFIAGLQGIAKEYYEAAALDGATGVQIFRHITWPLLWPITALVLTLQLIAQLKIFDQIYLLTNGGPFNTTLVTLLYMYREAFQRFDGGYSSTIAMALFIIILVASLLQYRFLRAGTR
jgi:multiple sugar transport system permease protein